MADNITPQKPHAIIVAYPLQGHVIPTVHLAIKLASKGFIITFINTESIHHQTIKSLPENVIGDNIFAGARKSGLDIRYYTVNDGLPLNFDRSLNHDQFMFCLLHVFSAHVEELIFKIIQTDPSITCLISDTFFVWSLMITQKFKLVNVSFWTEPALVLTLYYHLNVLKENGHFGCVNNREDSINYIPGVAEISPSDLMSYLQEKDLSTVEYQIISKAFNDAKEADFFLCNTVQELEPEIISAFQMEKPCYAIGPVFPTGFSKASVATSLWPESDCAHWLDTKPHGSVLYVSFGSYAHVDENDIMEIAYGLLLSKSNFVWVLRPDIVSSGTGDPLPEGFRKAVAGKGMIVPWCRQISVLSHPAIGGFLTHCGWNSILESVWCEVPMLCFPLKTDQITNRKLVVDYWRIGMDINGGKTVTREEVSENINRLMSGKVGDKSRQEIKEVRKILQNALMPDGSSEKNLNQFTEDLTARIREKCEDTFAQRI